MPIPLEMRGHDMSQTQLLYNAPQAYIDLMNEYQAIYCHALGLYNTGELIQSGEKTPAKEKEFLQLIQQLKILNDEMEDLKIRRDEVAKQSGFTVEEDCSGKVDYRGSPKRKLAYLVDGGRSNLSTPSKQTSPKKAVRFPPNPEMSVEFMIDDCPALVARTGIEADEAAMLQNNYNAAFPALPSTTASNNPIQPCTSATIKATSSTNKVQLKSSKKAKKGAANTKNNTTLRRESLTIATITIKDIRQMLFEHPYGIKIEDFLATFPAIDKSQWGQLVQMTAPFVLVTVQDGTRMLLRLSQKDDSAAHTEKVMTELGFVKTYERKYLPER